MSEKPLPESHEGLLKTGLRIEEGGDVPQHVVDLYWEFERLCRRVTCRGVQDDQIPLLLLIAGHGIKGAPTTFLDSNPALGSKCIVRWRGQWLWAQYQGAKGSNVLATLLDDTAEVREFKVTDVRAPTKEELKTIGEK